MSVVLRIIQISWSSSIVGDSRVRMGEDLEFGNWCWSDWSDKGPERAARGVGVATWWQKEESEQCLRLFAGGSVGHAKRVP